jgi:hypothetical protein
VTDDDVRWLEARERGDNVDHVDEARRARYARLEEQIAALPPEAPPPGWQERVLARARAEAKPRRSRVPWLVAGGLSLAAAAAAILWFGFGRRGELATLGYEHQGATVLGDAVTAGDTLVVRANTDRIVEIRVYDEFGRRFAGCTACDRDRAIAVKLVGPHHISVFAFAGCQPPASTTEAEDRAEATRRGCAVTQLDSRRVD